MGINGSVKEHGMEWQGLHSDAFEAEALSERLSLTISRFWLGGVDVCAGF